MNTTAKKRHTLPDGTAGTPDRGTLSLLARGTLRGIITATLGGAVLSLACTAIAYTNADPDALITPLALGTLAVSAAAGGFATWCSCRTAPLVCGSLCGLSLLLIFFFFSCFLPDALRGGTSDALSWGLRGGVMVFCLLGALMAANMPKKGRGKRKKRR